MSEIIYRVSYVYEPDGYKQDCGYYHNLPDAMGEVYDILDAYGSVKAYLEQFESYADGTLVRIRGMVIEDVS